MTLLGSSLFVFGCCNVLLYSSCNCEAGDYTDLQLEVLMQ